MSASSHPTHRPSQPPSRADGPGPQPQSQSQPQPQPQSIARLGQGYASTDHGHPLRLATALPPLASLTSAPEQAANGSPTAWRSSGLQNILNPSVDHSQRRTAQHSTQSVTDRSNSSTHYPGPGSGVHTSPRGRKRNDSDCSRPDADPASTSRTERRILSPRSPSLRATSLHTHRSPSLGHVLGPRADHSHQDRHHGPSERWDGRDGNAQQGPSLSSSRTSFGGYRHAEPAHPALPPAMSSGMGTYPPGQTPLPPANMSEALPLAYTKQSPNSPSFTGPSGNQLASPAIKSEGQPNFASLQQPTNHSQGHPPVQSGWKMAIETQQGRELLDVDIDYQQASKMADEKRKRNAGASARFRARRKEKEREASHMITGLQQEIREISDERDFYRNERNYFRDLFARTSPGTLPSRPLSPQPRRPHPFSMSGPESSHSNEFGRRDSEDSVATHHRAGDYSSSYSASGTMPATYGTAYPPQPASASMSSHPYALPVSESTQGQYADSRPAAQSTSGPPAGSALPHPPHIAPAHSSGLDPFRREASNRSWVPGRP